MKKALLMASLISLMFSPMIGAQCPGCGVHKGKSGSLESNSKATEIQAKVINLNLTGYNKSIQLADGKYFKYSFDKKPKMGVSILKVSVFDKKNRISDDFDVYVVADMPSMKGAHSSGDVKMKANKKGELLLPINFVMPGIWEIELKFHKNGQQAYYGSFQLKI